MVIFSQYLSRFDIPIPAFNKDRGCHIVRYPLFRSFPVSIDTELVHLFSKQPYVVFTASILLNKQLRPNQAYVMATLAFAASRLNQYAVQSIRLVSLLIVLFEPYGRTNAIKLDQR